MVVLDLVALLRVNRSLKASIAAAAIAGVRFVGIEDGHDKSMGRRHEGFGPLQGRVHLVVDVSDRLHIRQLADAPDGIGTGKFTTQPTSPERALGDLLRGVERPEPCQHHHHRPTDHHRGRDPWALTRVGHAVQQGPKATDFLAIGQDAAKNDYPCRFLTLFKWSCEIFSIKSRTS